MKTHTIQLEPDDDVISTLDEMSCAQTGRILLVWPKPRRPGAPGSGRILNRKLDLVLLQRHSVQLGAQLVLISWDPVVRFHARQLGIPLFKNPEQAEEEVWLDCRPDAGQSPALAAAAGRPRPDLQALNRQAHPPSRSWPANPAARLGLFALGVLAIVFIAAVFIPAAEIHLTPQTRSQIVALDMQASLDFPAASLAGQVPTHIVTVEVDGRDRMRSTGMTSVPYRQAVGRVLLTNLTDGQVQVPVETVVRSQGPDPVRFMIQEAGTVPAGRGQNLSLPVRAILPGESGNLEAGKLAVIEGPLGLSLTAGNLSATVGGADQQGPSPSPDDYEQLAAQLTASLHQTALQELLRRVHPDDLLLPDTLALAQVVEKTYDPSETQASDWLELHLRLQFQVQVAAGEDLRTIAAGVLDQTLPNGFQAASDDVRIINPSPLQPGAELLTRGDVTRWRLQAERQIQGEIPEGQAARVVLGRSRLQAAQALSAALPLAGPARIDLSPSWWPRLPYVPFRIVFVDESKGQ